MTIIYSGTPPTPPGFTDAQIAAMRTDLSEPTVQAIAAATNGQSAALTNARQSGAVGNGITDDTTAVQAIFTAASGVDSVIYFPAGTYLISSTITCTGSNSTAMRMYGDAGLNRGDAPGTIFKWVGAAGGKMFKFAGMNNSTLD